MHSRASGTRVLMRGAAAALRGAATALLVLLACGVEPVLPPITQLAAYRCGNADCTRLGARLEGLPPQTGPFMVGAWFSGIHDVHWTIRWPADSVQADFTGLRDSSIVGAQLDDMPLNAVLVLTVRLLSGGRDSLTWDYR